MSLILLSNLSAMGTNLKTGLSAAGGMAPYVYSVVAGGAGGTVNPSTGVYTSPNVTGTDLIQVTDAAQVSVTAPIAILSPLELFCEIIQNQLGLANGRVYLWDQKINQPTDLGLFIVVGVLNAKPFSSSFYADGSGSGFNEMQAVNVMANLSVDIMSRGNEAVTRKEEVVMALSSYYARSQMEANSFYIARLPNSFVDLSDLDGTSIPYRFNLSVNIQYSVRKTRAVPYYDTFATPSILTDP